MELDRPTGDLIHRIGQRGKFRSLRGAGTTFTTKHNTMDPKVRMTMARSGRWTGAAALLVTGMLLSVPALAGDTKMVIAPAPAPGCGDWEWGISADYMWREVDRNENYFSGPELWYVDYDDYKADLWGGTIWVTPPCLANTTFDFSYRQGDIAGTFMNYSLEPNSKDSGTYVGRADFDREEIEFGATIPCPYLQWLYGRVEVFRHEEDGVWDYGDGYFEAQEYKMWGAIVGVGAGNSIPLGGGGISLDLGAFLGLVYFDLEHEEVGGPTTSWDGFGWKGSVYSRINFPISECYAIYTGVGYEYMQTDDGSLDMSTQGLLVNLGIRGKF